jgi:aminoglycoside 3-N-acetyltransferase
MKEKPLITKEDIRVDLRQLGLREHDIVFFHSSLSSIGYVDGGADTVIDAFVDVVGEGGTVVVPTCVQYVDGVRASVEERRMVWDINGSPSDMGQITETLRKRTTSVRSDHPCENVCAIGKLAEEITEGHKNAYGRWSPWGEDAYGIGSPWEKLYQYNTHYLLLGVDFHVCTIFHYAQAVYLEENMKKVGESSWPEFDFIKMGRRLEQQGLVRFGHVGKAKVRAMRSRPMVDAVIQHLKNEVSSFNINDSIDQFSG